MSFKVIGINGKKRVGKDTLCKYLLKAAPIALAAKRLAFADPLKQELAEACGVSLEFIEEHKDNFRLLLQGWGTDFRRKLFSDNYWIEQMKLKLLQLEAEGHHLFIIPDVRFENEYMFVKSVGGIVVKVERNTCGIPDNHESERSIPNVTFDVNVSNNGEISYLDIAATQIIESYICPQ